MSAAVVHPLVHAAELEVYRQDSHRDLYTTRERIKSMTAGGMSAAEIACAIDMSKRNVVRHRSAEIPEWPKLVDPAEVSDERADELEETADLAMELAVRLRDENPELVSAVLRRMSRRMLHELAVAALAMVPVDGTVDELLGWVQELAPNNVYGRRDESEVSA